MTNDEMIIMLEQSTGEEDHRVLSAYLSRAADIVFHRAYPYAGDDDEVRVPKKYQHVQIAVAEYMLNKRGAEGQTQHIENGVHRNYGSADIPDDMLSSIVPYVGVIGE